MWGGAVSGQQSAKPEGGWWSAGEEGTRCIVSLQVGRGVAGEALGATEAVVMFGWVGGELVF